MPHHRMALLLAALVVALAALALANPGPAQAQVTNLIATNELGEPLDEGITTIGDNENLWAYITSVSGGIVCVQHWPVGEHEDCDSPGAWGGGAAPIFFAGLIPVAPAPLKPGRWQIIAVDQFGAFGPGEQLAASQPFRVVACDVANCGPASAPDPTNAKRVFQAVYDSMHTTCQAHKALKLVKTAQEAKKYGDMMVVGGSPTAPFGFHLGFIAGDLANKTLHPIEQVQPSATPYLPKAIGYGIWAMCKSFFGIDFPDSPIPFVSGPKVNVPGPLKGITRWLEDPPQPYESVQLADFIDFSQFDLDAQDDPDAIRMATSIDRLRAYLDAGTTAWERFQAAYVAGSEAERFAHAQAAAIEENFSGLRAAVSASAAHIDSLRTAIQADGTFPDSLNQAEIDAAGEIMRRVRDSGFTSAEIADLRAIGVDDAGLVQLREAIGGDTETLSPATSFVEELNRLAHDLYATRAALDDFARQAAVYAARTDAPPTARFSAAPVSPSDPLSMRFVDDSTSPDLDAIESISWDFGDGTTGEGARVDHTYAAPGSYDVTLEVCDRFACATLTRTLTVGLTTDLTLTQHDSPDPVGAGAQLTYTLVVANSAETNATNVTLTDQLPAGVTFVSAAAGCVHALGVVTCDLGTIPPGGGAVSVGITVTAPILPGTIQNAAMVTSSEADATPGDNSAVESTVVSADADLSVRKFDSHDPAGLGDSLTYSLLVHNAGPAVATGVTVTDRLPDGVDFVSAAPDDVACVHSSAAGEVVCSLGSLASGELRSLEIVVRTPSTSGTIANTATVAADQGDPEPSNNSESVETVIAAGADLELLHTADRDRVDPRAQLTYRLDVRNIGPNPATGVTLTDELPAGVSFVSSAPAEPDCVHLAATRTVTCDLGSLTRGGQRSVEITVAPTGEGTIENTARVTSTSNDPIGSNNVATLRNEVIRGGAVISNGTVQLGVNRVGSLNYDCLGPGDPDCPAPSITGVQPVGLRHLPFGAEGTAPGCLCEGWGVADAGSGLSGSANKAQRDVNVTVDSFEVEGPSSAVSTVSVSHPDLPGHRMRVVQDYHPSAASPNLYENTVTVTNTGDGPVSDLRYRRVMDWDVEPIPFQEWVTIQGTSPQLLFDSDDGFASADPLAGPSYISSQEVCGVGYTGPCSFTDLGAGGTYPGVTQPADQGALFDFGFGALAVGETKRFTVYYGAAPTETAALAAIEAAGAEVYSLGQSSCPVPGSVAECSDAAPNAGVEGGVPTTFIFAFVTTTGDLSISKTAPERHPFGEDLTYSLTVRNDGPDPASAVKVSDRLPDGVTLISTSTTRGTCTGETTIECDLGSLPDGAVETVTLVVRPTAAGSLSNTATVSSASDDAVPGNNSSTATTVVGATADLSMTKSDSPDPVTAGQPLTYTLTASNAGPSTATDVTLRDELPADVTFVSAGSGCSEAAGTVACAVGNLAGGASVSRDVIVRPTAAGSLSNTATVSSTTADPAPENNSATETTTVEAQPATLRVVKQVVNDNGGTKAAPDFSVHVKSGREGVAGSPAPGSAVGTTYTLAPGTYVVVEDAAPGYAASFSGACSAGGGVTLAAGESKTCTIVNDDIAPPSGSCLTYPDFSDPAGLNLLGSAAVQGGALRLTPADGNVQGQAWYGSRVAVALGFATDFRFRFTETGGIGDEDGAGADGITFAIQNHGADATGNLGGALGYDGLPNSLVVEFDTFNNGPFYGDPNGNHVAVHSRGTAPNAPRDESDSLLGVAALTPLMQDGVVHRARIVYDPVGVLRVYVDDLTVPALTVPVDLADKLALDNGTSFVGFTSATGSGAENHDLLDWRFCAEQPPPAPTLKVIKEVVNDDGGTKSARDFNLHVKRGGADVAGSPSAGSAAGITYTLQPGGYAVSEDPASGYAQSFVGDCDSSGQVTLEVGQQKTCTVTNDDVAPTLTVVKQVVNDDGGTAVAGDWTMHIKTGLPAADVPGSPFAGSETGSTRTLAAGSYFVSESGGPSGYAATVGGDCNAGGQIILRPGDNKTCTITNNDTGPPPDSSCGSVVSGRVFVTGHDPDFHAVSGAPGSNVEGARRILQRAVGFVTGELAEPRLLLVTGTSGGEPGTLDPRQGLTEAGLSFDVAHAAEAGEGVLDLRTVDLAAYDAMIVASDFGGWLGQAEVDVLNARASELAAFVSAGGGLVALAESHVSDAYGFLPFLVGRVPANTQADTVAVTGFGQQLGLSNTDVNGSFYHAYFTEGSVLEPVDIDEMGTADSSDDQIISLAGRLCSTLTVVKQLVNDHGGAKTSADFDLHVTADGVDVTGSPQPGDPNGTTYPLQPGEYVVSEDDVPGYAGTFSGDCNASGQVTLEPGEQKTCTVTNDDVAPRLTVVKQVVNDDGGTKAASDFSVHVRSGGADVAGSPQPGTAAGTLYTLEAGSFSVAEDPMAGYEARFSGACDASGRVDLEPGDEKVCTITNDDVAPTLTVVKQVLNDDGGTAVAGDWTMHIRSGLPLEDVAGKSPFPGEAAPGTTRTLAAGSYVVSESGRPAGYAVSFSGDCNGSGQVTLEPGQHKTCTVTNDDVAPTLTVIKRVVNDDRGAAVAGDWTMHVKSGLPLVDVPGASPFAGAGSPGVTRELAAGSYVVSESGGPAGYTASFMGDCDADGRVTLEVGENKTCTVTNDDVPSRAPVAQDQSVTLEEDSSREVVLQATDPDDDPLSYAIESGPQHGVLGPLSDGKVTYVPFANYNGPDSFTFTASDGDAESNVASVSITVTPVNDAPVLTLSRSDVGAQYSDPIEAVSLRATDVDGLGGLTVSAPALPADLALTPPSIGGGAVTAAVAGRINVAAGEYPVPIVVSDGDGGNAGETLTIRATREDAAVVDIGPSTVTAEGNDGDADALSVGMTVIEADDGHPSRTLASGAGLANARPVELSLTPLASGAARTCSATNTTYTAGAIDRASASCAILDLPVGRHGAAAVIGGSYFTGSGGGTITVEAPPPPAAKPVLLVLDADSIDKGFAKPALRRELPFFDASEGRRMDLRTGQVGDEGWFALKTIPATWAAAGPTTDGLRNYVGRPGLPYPHDVGPGLGTGRQRDSLLDRVPGVTPLRTAALGMLEGRSVCAVVHGSDVSINFNPLSGNLKGSYQGTVAFEVGAATPATKPSSSSLPKIRVEILDAEEICEEPLELFTEAPEPSSSSRSLTASLTRP